MIRPFTHTLRNGLRIVCVEMPHLHAVELAVHVKVGSRNDPPGRAGLSHFLEHMLFRGTAELPTTLDIEKAFETIGGAPNAATDAESTCYYSRIHPDHVRRGMELFASMLLRPLLEGIGTERRIISEEAREDLNERGEEISPDLLASRLLWPRHPLGLPTIGTLESIGAIDESDLRSHLAGYYRPGSAVVAVAGPVRSHEVFAAAEEVFDSWEQGAGPEPLPAPHRRTGGKLCLVADSDSQMSLQLAFLALPRSDARFTTLRLVRRLLAGGGSSRLYLRLREEMGIIYSVDAAIGAYEETGCFTIDLSTAPGTLAQAVEGVLDELLRLVEEQVPEEELERVRRSYIFDLEYSRDSAYEMGGRYGWGELMGAVRSIGDDRREACEVTAAGIRDLCREIFSPDHLCLIAVGPWKKGMKGRVREQVARYRQRLTPRAAGGAGS